MVKKRTTLGRSDGTEPWLSANARANIILGALALTVLLAWHLCVVFAAGAGLFDLPSTVRALVHADPVHGLPGHPNPSSTRLLVTFGAVILGVFVVVAAWSWLFNEFRSRRRGHRAGGAGLADKDAADSALGEDKARKAAKRLRPSLSESDLKEADQIGLKLGEDLRSGKPLYLGFEDSAGILGPAGAGKSSCFMEPAALGAPGPLIVTSNEVGILDTIAGPRGRKGTVWVFDPLNRSAWPRPMVWDPVAGCEDGEMALARAKAFVAGCGADGSDSTNAGFFRQNAEQALKAMLHAAAIDTETRTMNDVLTWCSQLNEGANVPRNIITNSLDPRVEPDLADELRSVATGAEQTVASSRNTLAQVVTPLTLKAVKKWVIPHDDFMSDDDGELVTGPVATFNAHDFVRSNDTLVLLSDDSSSTNVGPLCTMLFQEVIDAIKAWVPMSESGVLDPPMRIVGDEIANIAPVEKLPELVTELRKLGVQCLLAFQSDQQAITRWGQERAKKLWENMAAEVVLPGVKSVSALERYSDLAGTVEVLERTDSFDHAGTRTGTSRQLHERKVLRPDEIRQLDPGVVLIIYRNSAGILAQTQPWFERPDAAKITAERKRSSAARRDYYTQLQRAKQDAMEASKAGAA